MEDQGWFVVLIGVVALGVHTLGILHAAHAVMSVRTAQGTIAWVVSLVMFPWVAVPFYWVFGRNRFQGYVESRRALDGQLRSSHAAGDEDAVKPLALVGDDVAPVPGDAHGFLRLSEGLGGHPVRRKNRVELLIDGAEGFASMLGLIGLAKNYILVQFFIVHSDRLGGRFKDALVRKARQGVAVYFQYDEFGSRKLKREFVDDLRAAGVQVTAFGANRGPGNRFQLNFRNHRKTLVIDGECAFVGGLNLGDEYLGRFAGLAPWRDTHLRIRGAAARDLQHVFVEDWFWATREVPELCWDCGGTPGGCDVLVVPTGPADPVESCQLLIVNAIHSAEERIWIASPYFVPDPAVVTALQSAALRGIDVRVMLPAKPDHLLVYLSSFAFYPDMFACGVRIFRYHEGFLHQKVFLVDSALAAVGTANLDNRSFRLNFEVTALVADSAFAREVEEMLKADFDGSTEAVLEDYTGRPLWFRAACRLSRLVSPIQ